MFRPKSVDIFSKVFKIEYKGSQTDIDIKGERLLFGHIDPLSGTIRILDNGKLGEGEVVSTIFEEVLHGLEADLRVKISHPDLARLAMGLADVFLRNGWLKDGK